MVALLLGVKQDGKVLTSHYSNPPGILIHLLAPQHTILATRLRLTAASKRLRPDLVLRLLGIMLISPRRADSEGSIKRRLRIRLREGFLRRQALGMTMMGRSTIEWVRIRYCEHGVAYCVEH